VEDEQSVSDCNRIAFYEHKVECPYEVGEFHQEPVEPRTNFNIGNGFLEFAIVDRRVEREEPPGNCESNHNQNADVV